MTAGTGHTTEALLTPAEVSFTRWVSKHPVLGVLAFTLSFIGISLWGPEHISASGQRVTYSIVVAIPLTMSPMTFGLFARLLMMLDRNVTIQENRAGSDALTGILNRRGFSKAAELAREQCESPMIALVDVDDFKLINDEHGHEFGDKALVAIADWLDQQTGESGIAARVGGDGFVFLGENAEVLDIHAHFITVDGIEFSISIGNTSWRRGQTLREAMSEADDSLYRYKKVKNERKTRNEPALRNAA